MARWIDLKLSGILVLIPKNTLRSKIFFWNLTRRKNHKTVLALQQPYKVLTFFSGNDEMECLEGSSLLPGASSGIITISIWYHHVGEMYLNDYRK